MALAADATIADVATTLQNPDEYIRVVLQNMFECKSKHGNAVVRIGITATGQVPYHKVSFLIADGTEVLYAAFDGKHPFGDLATHEGNWSSAIMTLAEVGALRVTLRDRRRRGTR